MSTTEWAKNPQTNAPRSITEPAAPEPLGDSEGAATQVVAGLEPDRGLLGRIDDLQNDLATMTKKADGFFDALQLAAKINAEGQAREKQLREALEICKKEMPGDKWDSLYIDGVLAFPQDDTALNTLLAAGQAREQQLREALEYYASFDYSDDSCPVAEDAQQALAIPQDDTALNTLLAAGQAREQQLREALELAEKLNILPEAPNDKAQGAGGGLIAARPG